ncbi:hypothetical protein ACGF12_19125 [Kitasatospora sp. NPDC048296]|uniref:hypothetical protein n=1 Tax=Kitasatospora sp. NPDC048296 TaxID=3364048 RepID=UPI0037136232
MPAAAVSGPEFQQMLTELLPSGTVAVGEARGTESDTPQLRLVLDDGHGPVQYLFWITRFPGGNDTGCPSGTAGGDACTEATLPDGGHLRLYRAGTRDGEPAGSKTWSAKLTVDGYQLMLQEWNRKPLEQGAPITRTDPPLTMDQLAAVVKDPRWQKVAAALPKDPVTGKDFTPTPPPGKTQLTVPPPGLTTLPALPASGWTPPPGFPTSGPYNLPGFPTPGR